MSIFYTNDKKHGKTWKRMLIIAIDLLNYIAIVSQYLIWNLILWMLGFYDDIKSNK